MCSALQPIERLQKRGRPAAAMPAAVLLGLSGAGAVAAASQAEGAPGELLKCRSTGRLLADIIQESGNPNVMKLPTKEDLKKTPGRWKKGILTLSFRARQKKVGSGGWRTIKITLTDHIKKDPQSVA